MWTVWMRINRMYFIWMRTNRICTNWMRTYRMYTVWLRTNRTCNFGMRTNKMCTVWMCTNWMWTVWMPTTIRSEKKQVTLINLFRMWMGWNRTQFLNQYKFYCFIISMQLLLQMSTLLLLWQMSLNRDFFFVTTFRHPWMLASMAGWHLYLVPELHVN